MLEIYLRYLGKKFKEKLQEDWSKQHVFFDELLKESRKFNCSDFLPVLEELDLISVAFEYPKPPASSLLSSDELKNAFETGVKEVDSKGIPSKSPLSLLLSSDELQRAFDEGVEKVAAKDISSCLLVLVKEDSNHCVTLDVKSKKLIDYQEKPPVEYKLEDIKKIQFVTVENFNDLYLMCGKSKCCQNNGGELKFTTKSTIISWFSKIKHLL